MDCPTYRWNSKCYFCSDQLFYQVNGNACVFLWVHVIAKVGAQESESKPAISRRANTDSIFSWTVKNKLCQRKVLKTLPSAAIIWGKHQLGRCRNRVKGRRSQHPSREPKRLQFTCTVIFRHKRDRSRFKTNTFLNLYGRNAKRPPLTHLLLEVPWSQQNISGSTTHVIICLLNIWTLDWRRGKRTLAHLLLYISQHWEVEFLFSQHDNYLHGNYSQYDKYL